MECYDTQYATWTPSSSEVVQLLISTRILCRHIVTNSCSAHINLARRIMQVNQHATLITHHQTHVSHQTPGFPISQEPFELIANPNLPLMLFIALWSRLPWSAQKTLSQPR
jgi:hypothetical protein